MGPRASRRLRGWRLTVLLLCPRTGVANESGESSCTITAPGLGPGGDGAVSFACFAGTFGAFLPLGRDTYTLDVFGPNEFGCGADNASVSTSAGAAGVSAVAVAPLGPRLGCSAPPLLRGVLVQRGKCSFFDKSSFAMARGATLLVVVDTASTSPLIPTIAQWGAGLKGLLALGMSSEDGARLRGLTDASSESESEFSSSSGGGGVAPGFGPTRRLVVTVGSAAAEGTRPPHVASNPPPASSSCVVRAQLLIHGGLIASAAQALHSCEDRTANRADGSFSLPANTTREGLMEDARASLGVSVALLAAGLDAASGDWACRASAKAKEAKAVAARGARGVGSGSGVDVDLWRACHGACGQALLRRGDAGHARRAFKAERSAASDAVTDTDLDAALGALKSDRAAPEGFEAAAEADDKGRDKWGLGLAEAAVTAARLAALDFLLADNVMVNEGERARETRTVAAVAAWAGAMAVFSAAPQSSTGKRRTPAAALRSSFEIPSSSSSLLPLGVGHGDGSVWLLFTLVEELATVLRSNDAADAAAAPEDSEAGKGKGEGGGLASSPRLAACADGIDDDRWNCCDVDGGGGGSVASERRLKAEGLFLAQLLDVRVTLALFLDEAGFFHLADRHLELAVALARRLCQPEVADGLLLRRTTLTPTVFDSLEDMEAHRARLHLNLTLVIAAWSSAWSAHEDSDVPRSSSPGPTKVFLDPTLAYTATPATMMIGYQGLPYLGGPVGAASTTATTASTTQSETKTTTTTTRPNAVGSDRDALRLVAMAYLKGDESLGSEVSAHLDRGMGAGGATGAGGDEVGFGGAPLQQRDEREGREAPSATPTRVATAAGARQSGQRRLRPVRAGFVSSFLRSHSVGRLLAPVLGAIDPLRVEVHAFVATHFFRAHTSEVRSHPNGTAAAAAAAVPAFDDPVTQGLVEALGPHRVHVLPRPLPVRQGGGGVGRPSGEALALVASFRLDVVVYPELGMDQLTVFMAMTRLAPVQCVFWGHPVSQGLPAIDYFLSSDLFEHIEPSLLLGPQGYGGAPDATMAATAVATATMGHHGSRGHWQLHDNGAPAPPPVEGGDRGGQATTVRIGRGGGPTEVTSLRAPSFGPSRYHEQLIRFGGLGALFSKPPQAKPPQAKPMAKATATAASAASAASSPLSFEAAGADAADAADATDAADAVAHEVAAKAAVASLGLPSDSHLYVVPQTLMKFHPAFDAALGALLATDPLGVIVVTFSANQRAWQAKLEARIAAAVAAALNKVKGGRAAQKAAAAVRPSFHPRVRFVRSLEHGPFLELLRGASAVLDPFPFGGGVTSLEALSVGAPVVTCPALQAVVQLAAGFYQHMDHRARSERACSAFPPWPVAPDAAGFVAAAARLGMDPHLRAALQRRILEHHAALYGPGGSGSEGGGRVHGGGTGAASAGAEWTALLARLGRPPALRSPENVQEGV